ncbi:hypothetical protein F5X97DRAFT_16732 [Nemania serpens]|nr:hypothetical protein F5X97DRAFT_16732 [Nemania serpens]
MGRCSVFGYLLVFLSLPAPLLWAVVRRERHMRADGGRETIRDWDGCVVLCCVVSCRVVVKDKSTRGWDTRAGAEQSWRLPCLAMLAVLVWSCRSCWACHDISYLGSLEKTCWAYQIYCSLPCRG